VGSSVLNPMDLLEALRKTGSKYGAARDLEVSTKTQAFEEAWTELIDSDLIEDSSGPHGGPRWVITRKGVKKLAKCYDGGEAR